MARRRRPRRRRFVRRRRRRAGIVRGRLHPPVNIASPWNRVVLTTSWKPTAAGHNSLFAASVCAYLKSELGLSVTKDKVTTSQVIEVRFLRLDVWSDPSISGSHNNFIVFSPHNFISEGALTWIEAWGTPTQPANLHYVWPRSISSYVFKDDSSKVIGLFDAAAGCRYIFKMHMLWRPAAPAPKPEAEITLAGWRYRLSACSDAEDYCVVSPTTEVVERFGTL